jgi:zinc/manganese transport system ATP-binding protein
MPAFRLDNVTLGYDGHPAINNLAGDVGSGTLTAVIGPNGAGKSTLLKGLVGSLKPLGGSIERIGFKAHDIAYLPQASDIDRSFPATVEDLVSLGLWRSRGLFAALTRADDERLSRALAAVGLNGFAARPIDSLSGGQVQRALFARVLLQDARVILLDEPFAAIDSRTVADLISLVRRWHKEARTVIAVLHDIELVRRHFPHTILLSREAISWGSTEEALRPENLHRARQANDVWRQDAPWLVAS